MTTSKKKAIIIIAIIAAIAIAVVVIIVSVNGSKNKGAYYEKRWSIDLPNDMKSEFETGQTHMDGSVKYTVFTCKTEQDEFLNGIGKHLPKDTFERYVNQAIAGLVRDMPTEWRPDFESDYQCAYFVGVDGNRATYLYIAYFPDSKIMMLCQDVRQYAHELN